MSTQLLSRSSLKNRLSGVRARLLSMVAAVLALTIVVGVVGFTEMSSLNTQTKRGYTEGTLALDGLRTLEKDWWERSTYQLLAIFPNFPAEQRASSGKLAQETEKDISQLQRTLDNTKLPPAAAQAYRSFKLSKVALDQNGIALTAALAKGDSASVASLTLKSNQLSGSIMATLATATADAQASAAARLATSQRSFDTGKITMLVTVAFALLLGIVLSLFTSRTITRPLRRIRDVLEQVTRGDLRVRVGNVSSGELGEVARSLVACRL